MYLKEEYSTYLFESVLRLTVACMYMYIKWTNLIG